MTRLAVLVVCALTAPVALAQKSSDEAKTHFKRGAENYDDGNFRAALIEFERAWQLLPNYKLLYNIGQVHLQLLEYARAQEAFVRYLKEGGSEVNSGRRDEVTRELERIKTRVGRISVVTADGAEVLLDDESVGVAPLPASVVANVGRHKVTVVVPGKPPESRQVEVAGLETATVTLGREVPAVAAKAPEAAAAPAPVTTVKQSAPAAPVVHSKTPMIVAWAGTGVLAVTAGVFAGLAFSSAAELGKLKGTLGVSQTSLNAAAGKVGTFSAVADVLGLAAIVTGAVSLFLTVNALSSNEVAVSLGPTGISVFARF